MYIYTHISILVRLFISKQSIFDPIHVENVLFNNTLERLNRETFTSWIHSGPMTIISG